MGQVVTYLSSKKLTELQMADARDRCGPDTFTDDELHHLYITFQMACRGKSSKVLNKKGFQQYIRALDQYRRAGRDEAFEPLFRAFDREHTGDQISWSSFLDFHTAMKFGLTTELVPPSNTSGLSPEAAAAAGGKRGGAASDGYSNATLSDDGDSHSLTSPEASLPEVTEEALNAAAVSAARARAAARSTASRGRHQPGLAPTLARANSINIVHGEERTAAEWQLRRRELLANVMFDIFCESRTSSIVSRYSLADVLKRTIRWVADDTEIRDEQIDAQVSSLFREAKAARTQLALTKDGFIAAFMTHDRFARHLVALV